MKVIKNLLVCGCVTFFFTGCSDFYHYLQEPTPLKKEISKFQVNKVNVGLYNLGADEESIKIYPSENELSLVFKNSFIKSLKDTNRYCENGLNCFEFNIDVNYQRVYGVSKKSVSYPVYSYFVTITDKNKELVKFNRIEITLDRGAFDGFKRLSKSVSPTSNLDDEKSDIQFITDLIVKDELNKLGE